MNDSMRRATAILLVILGRSGPLVVGGERSAGFRLGE